MVKTPVHGNITRPVSWFTWKPRRKVWISWPRAVVAAVTRLEQMDEATPFVRKGLHAGLGDFIQIGDRGGFVTKLASKGVTASRSQGIVFNHLESYTVAMLDADGSMKHVTVKHDDVIYDTTRSIWFADPSDVSH